jgi:hypothetical protein
MRELAEKDAPTLCLGPTERGRRAANTDEPLANDLVATARFGGVKLGVGSL